MDHANNNANTAPVHATNLEGPLADGAPTTVNALEQIAAPALAAPPAQVAEPAFAQAGPAPTPAQDNESPLARSLLGLRGLR